MDENLPITSTITTSTTTMPTSSSSSTSSTTAMTTGSAAAATTVRRSEINALVMDYLLHEGFKEAAERFADEAGMDRSMTSGGGGLRGESAEAMNRRIQIRAALEGGRIPDAMRLLNDYHPELVDSRRDLFFKLQQQHLIELVRDQAVDEALRFAQEQLSVDGDYLQLPDLERTLALLAFDRPEESPYGDLLEYKQRQNLATAINEAILEESSPDEDGDRGGRRSGGAGGRKPPLLNLMKLLLWSQEELERKKIPFHKLTDIATPSLGGRGQPPPPPPTS